MKKIISFPALLCWMVLLLQGCSTDKISVEAIKNALANEENCLKACDEKANKAWADFKDCTKPYQEKLQRALNLCSHVPPPNRLECETKAFENFVADIAQCQAAYENILAEVEKCRKNCRDLFPLELKIK